MASQPRAHSEKKLKSEVEGEYLINIVEEDIAKEVVEVL